MLIICRVFASFQSFSIISSFIPSYLQSALVDSSQKPPAGLSPTQYRGVTQLSALPAFSDVLKKLSAPDVQAWLHTDTPEIDVPALWDVTAQLTSVGESLHKLLLIQVYCLESC